MRSRGRAWLDRLVTWSPVLLLGSLAALTYWLNAQVHVVSPAFDGSGRHEPDLFVENFKAFNLDQEGRVRQALTAKRADHFPDDDTTEFEDPVITFTDPGKPRLNVTADRGKITGDRENAYFIGHVKAVREAAAGDTGSGPVTMTSEFLHVIPNEEKIVTDRPVTITDPRGIINATGMELDNKTRTLRFKSRVSGQLQPHTSPG